MTETTVIAIVGVMALVPAFIARRKGHSFVGYYVFGLLLWIVAVPHALTRKDLRARCPECREVVQADATRCPHCGSVIEAADSAPHAARGILW